MIQLNQNEVIRFYDIAPITYMIGTLDSSRLVIHKKLVPILNQEIKVQYDIHSYDDCKFHTDRLMSRVSPTKILSDLESETLINKINHDKIDQSKQ